MALTLNLALDWKEFKDYFVTLVFPHIKTASMCSLVHSDSLYKVKIN